jgi:YfiH family protein
MFKNKNGYIQYFDNKINLGFTTRENGFSDVPYNSNNMSLTVGDNVESVINNRKKLANQLNISLDKFIFMDQKHTNNIQKVSISDSGRGAIIHDNAIANTDGMYTFDANLVLTSFHADCVPIYFYSSIDKLIGVVHAGWEGTSKNIAKAFIDKMKQENIQLKNLKIIIGPASGKNNYEVEEDVMDKFRMNPVNNLEQAYKIKNETKYLLDVKKVNYLQLIEAGVDKSQIYVSPEETTTDIKKYFSFRVEGKTGRMITFIVRAENDETDK